MAEQPVQAAQAAPAELYDFLAAASEKTNEQKILATLERIEMLLQPKSGAVGGPGGAPSSAELVALAKATPPKKGFGRK